MTADTTPGDGVANVEAAEARSAAGADVAMSVLKSFFIVECRQHKMGVEELELGLERESCLVRVSGPVMNH